MVEGFKVKWNLKLLSLFSLLSILFLGFIITSGNASASTAQATQATVDFWSSSSSTGQVQATVNLPWDASIGGSASNTQQFYLNNISMIFPISAPSGTSNVYGRLTMRFTPNFTSTENAFFCEYNLNDFTSSVNGMNATCSATVIYYYGDGTTYQTNAPLYFNFTLPSGSLVAYVDYNQPIPNSGLSQVGLYIAKSGNNDVYSITNGYSLVLTTLVSEGSYYTNGSAIDLSPIINQNNTIINQNQQTYDWLTDNSEPNVDASGLGSVGGWLPAGPVDSILTLPVVLAQGILGVFTGTHTCTPIVLPLNISGVNLTIPCLDEYFRMSGISLIWNGIGAIISGFIIYDTFKWLYKFVDDTLTFRENNSSMWGGL